MHKPRVLLRGLRLLLEACELAGDAGVDRWMFAVTIGEFYRLQLSEAWLRWLILQGYVEHRHEIADPHDDTRHFQSQGRMLFTKSSCFVLTASGVNWSRSRIGEAVNAHPSEHLLDISSSSRSNGHHDPEHPDSLGDGIPNGAPFPVTAAGLAICSNGHPVWDTTRRELWFHGQRVKAFKRPAPAQEVILMAFEEEGWPVHIDDPIPPSSGLDRHQRLKSTVHNLNKHQHLPGLRFSLDGRGEGILWSPLSAHNGH